MGWKWQNSGSESAGVIKSLKIAESRTDILAIVLGHPQIYPKRSIVCYGIDGGFSVPETGLMALPLADSSLSENV